MSRAHIKGALRRILPTLNNSHLMVKVGCLSFFDMRPPAVQLLFGIGV